MRRALLLAALFAAPAAASTPSSTAALDRQSERACLAAAKLNNANVAPATRFSDRMRVDARVVTGTWPQAHMRGATATMLCLYDRRSRRAEVQELTLAAAPPTAGFSVQRDRFWRAVEIDGRPPAPAAKPVTIYFGSDGRVAGVSGCNNYSARYMLEGLSLRIFPPLIGTRMACPPGATAVERRVQDILVRAAGVGPGPREAMVLTSDDGAAIMFAPQ